MCLCVCAMLNVLLTLFRCFEVLRILASFLFLSCRNKFDPPWRCDHCLRKHLWWSRTLSSMKLLVPPWWKHSKRSPGTHSIPGQFPPCPTHSLLRTESCMKPTCSRWPLSWRGCVKIQQTSRSWSLKAVENCQRPKPDPSTPWVEGHHGPGCDSWHQFLFWEAAGHDRCQKILDPPLPRKIHGRSKKIIQSNNPKK